MNTTGEQPRVWIGCLACYNAGRLVGTWVDAVDADGVMPADVHRSMVEAGTAVVSADDVYVEADGSSPHEELWCMDHQGFSGAIDSECSPAHAAQVAEAMAEAIENGLGDAFGEWVEHEGAASIDWDTAAADFREAFLGEYDSLGDFACEMAEGLGTIDPNDAGRWPFTCIDWEKAGRELELGGDVWTAPAGFGAVYVFSAN